MAYNMLYETYVGADDYSLSLKHHGIKGQKWGVRRFQNADGSLTDAGRKRYGYNPKFEKVKRVYNVTENGAKLRPAYEAWQNAEQKVKEAKDKFWDKGPDDPEYNALVNKVVNDFKKQGRIDNDPELVELTKMEALDGKRDIRQHSFIANDLYNEYKKNHPNVQALEDDAFSKLKEYDRASTDLTFDVVAKAGRKTLDNWVDGRADGVHVKPEAWLKKSFQEEAEEPGRHVSQPTMLERVRGKMAEVNQTISEKKAQRAEAERAKAIEDGDAKTLLKYADTMSTNELRDAINRANTMKQLKDLADGGNRKSTMERIQNAATKMANFGNAIANAKGAYDRLQKAFATEDNDDPVEKARNDAYEKSVNADAIKAMNKARDQAKAAGASTKDQELAAYVARQKHYEAVDYAKKRTAELNEARARAEATIKRQNTMKQVKELPGKAQSSFYKILDGGEWVTNKDGNSEWRQTKVSDLFKKK